MLFYQVKGGIWRDGLDSLLGSSVSFGKVPDLIILELNSIYLKAELRFPMYKIKPRFFLKMHSNEQCNILFHDKTFNYVKIAENPHPYYLPKVFF